MKHLFHLWRTNTKQTNMKNLSTSPDALYLAGLIEAVITEINSKGNTIDRLNAYSDLHHEYRRVTKGIQYISSHQIR